MSITQQPASIQGQSIFQRVRRFWLRLIEPHPSIKAIGEFRRAQLLSILTLILSLLFIGALLSLPRSFGVFLSLGGITLISYILSKTRYYRLGTYIFSYAFTAIGYLRIYQGTANSIESSIVSTVHIALVFSSVLLSKRGFLSLAILSTIATFTAPFYSNSPIVEGESITRTGGVVFVISMVLYGIHVFRSNVDKEQLKELTDANRELEELATGLEQSIGVRTAALEQVNQKMQDRAARFQIISEISQEISSNVDQRPAELLNRIASSTSEKLGYYHVGIFLIDDTLEYAVLHATNSPGGQRMLERGHQLKVGGTGIVGYVSQSGRPRIALDTGTDAVFFNNPDLPGTRSEIALPLKYGTKTIGVLDVQSTLPSDFNDEDSNLLSTLANQLGIVINSLLITERSEFGLASQKITKRDWQQNQKMQVGYSYFPDGTISIAIPANNPTIEQAIASGETVVLTQSSTGKNDILAVPVKFREQVIGVIQIEASEPNRHWTENELAILQAISDRAAFALENARLFEDSVRRADQEQMIAHVTSQIGSSTDFNRILQTTIQELGQALGTTRSFIQMGPLSGNEIENKTV